MDDSRDYNEFNQDADYEPPERDEATREWPLPRFSSPGHEYSVWEIRRHPRQRPLQRYTLHPVHRSTLTRGV